MSFEFGFALPALNNLGAAPSLNLNFLSGTLDSRITFSRGSTATYYDSSGTLVSAAINAPRFDYNPSTLAARGLLIEEARTNSVRNSSAVGGSAGVAPTNWSANGTNQSGITVTVVGVGTENGMPYVDLNFAGTSTLTGTAVTYYFEGQQVIAASSTQTWANSLSIKLVSGSVGDGNAVIRARFNDSAGNAVLYVLSSNLTVTSAALSSQRFSLNATASSSTAYVTTAIAFRTVNGSTYNVTLRVAYPQAELGAFATSVIPTTTAAATRSADIATMTGTNFSSWYNQSQGTFITQFVLEGVKSVAGQRTIAADDGTNTNQILQSGSSTNTFQTQITTAGASQVSQTVPTITLTGNTVYKAALAYATNNTISAVNAVLATNDTSCTMPTALTTFRFSTSGTSPTTVNANLWYASLNYYPTRLSNGTLQTLTT